MKDVGILAGVSRTTVDRVLQNKGYVSKTAREKIEKALEQLGYSVNRYASALSKSSFFKVDLMIPEHFQDSYYDFIERGIMEEYDTISYSYKDCSLFLYNSHSAESFIEKSKDVIAYNPSALIFGPVGNFATISSFIKDVESNNIPYIILDSFADCFNPISFYGQNGNSSGRFLASILHICQIDKKIGVVKSINEGRTISQQEIERENGFMLYFKQESPYSVIENIQIDFKSNVANDIKRYIKAHPDFDSIVTFNSSIGLIADAIKEISPTISLIGYDTSSINVEKLENGKIDFLICQNPILQGREALRSIFDYTILNFEQSKYHYFPIDLISKENLKYYLSYEDGFHNIFAART